MSIHNLLNDGQFAVRPMSKAELEQRERGRATINQIVNEYNEAAARVGAQSLSLEDQLRASVAREEKRKMAHEDLYTAIEKRRSELLEDLARARKTREEISATIKAAQDALDALDALPVPKTRRSKTKKVEEFVGGRDRTAREESRGAG